MEPNEETIHHLETYLNHFDPGVRRQALAELVALAEQGRISLPAESDVVNPPDSGRVNPPDSGRVNMHCHTFFSFNAYGYSPTGLAWLALKRGFRLIGIIDFDVLDGVEEFLAACEIAGVRGSTGIETRVFIPEFASYEINSPGEPGVSYAIGLGFTSTPLLGGAQGDQAPDEAGAILQDMRQRASRRNRDMLGRLNPFLAPVSIDFEGDVLPLTPAGNPTERHLLAAYVSAAQKAGIPWNEFWAEKLKVTPEQVAKLGQTSPEFQNLMRSKLMKRGGVGYVQPGAGSFPTLDDVNKMIMACGALPCCGWLDGISSGEQRMAELLELMISKGAVTFNIIPDRNWNIADLEQRRVKVNNLYQAVELAQKMDLPINVGTEMNTYGNKLVDDFDAPELAPLHKPFLDGAYFIYGHTQLQRSLGLGYLSEWAKAYLPTRKERNAFYTQAGYRLAPGKAGQAQLMKLSPRLSPAELLASLAQ
jgi:hypothetical protein